MKLTFKNGISGDEVFRKGFEINSTVLLIALFFLLMAIILLGCSSMAQSSFDQMMGCLTTIFGPPTPPSSGGVFVINSRPRPESPVVSDDKSYSFDQNRSGGSPDYNRRKSTSNLNNEIPLKTAVRRSTLAVDSFDKTQLKFLAIHNSYSKKMSKGDDFKLGSIVLSLKYNTVTNILQIHVLEAKNLPPVDTGGEIDPYIKITIYPGNFDTLQTKTFYKTRNPKFDESKVFKGISETDLNSMILNLKLYDWNRIQNDRIIGEINFNLGLLLESEIKEKKRIIEFEKNLEPTKDAKNFLGLLLVSLHLDLSKEQLHVSIIRGKNLKAMDRNNLSDPYCIIKLGTSSLKLGTKKTSVKYKTVNPVWNELFTFPVKQKNFSNKISLCIKILDKNPINSDLIGVLRFSNEGSFSESKHWKAMIMNQNESVAEWHSIKSSS